MTESNPEDEIDAGSSNPSSEKVDSDSSIPEIANSMMTVLLPRALPLLKTFSRRKRNKLKPLEKSKDICMDENGMNKKRSLAVLSHGNLLTYKLSFKLFPTVHTNLCTSYIVISSSLWMRNLAFSFFPI